MGRKKFDVDEDLMVACPACAGSGSLGFRGGRPVNCPTCHGEGRCTPREYRRYETQLARRLDAYDGESVVLGNGAEAARISGDRFAVPPLKERGEIEDGPPVVVPVVDHRSAVQQFMVVSGLTRLRELIAASPDGVDVTVDVSRTSTQGVPLVLGDAEDDV